MEKEVETPDIEKEVGKTMKKTDGKLISLKLNQIKPYKNNAKIHTEKQIDKIRNSIIKFGYKDLIAVDEKNVILEGHGRLIALYQIDTTGTKEIQAWQITDFNEKEKKLYRIAHNKIGMDTGFDDNFLKIEFEGMEMIKSGALCQVARSDLRVKVDKVDKNTQFGRENE